MEKQITAVLIDTSAYINRQCDFAGIMSAMIPTFLRLMETNHIPVLSHPVLDGEIRKHIYESDIVKRAAKLWNTIHSNKAITDFAGLRTKEILEQASAEKVTNALVFEYEEFAKSFVMLPYVDAQEVFADYFGARPPFSATGDKKSEFPDAFVLKGLLKHCAEHPDEQILVISNDPDWKRTLADNCQIQMVDTLKDGLKHMWPQLGDKEEFVWQIWHAKIVDIMIKVAETAECEAFSVDGIYELEDIAISNICTTGMVGDMTPLEITEDSVLVHATVSLSVDGAAEYLDESRSVWDNEDGMYYFLAYSRMTFKNAFAEAECEIRLGFPADGSMNPIEIKNVRITNKWDICVDVSEADVTYEDITDYGTND